MANAQARAICARFVSHARGDPAEHRQIDTIGCAHRQTELNQSVCFFVENGALRRAGALPDKDGAVRL